MDDRATSMAIHGFVLWRGNQALDSTFERCRCPVRGLLILAPTDQTNSRLCSVGLHQLLQVNYLASHNEACDSQTRLWAKFCPLRSSNAQRIVTSGFVHLNSDIGNVERHYHGPAVGMFNLACA